MTFSGNHGNQKGGGLFNYGNSRPTLTNVILWGDGSEIYNDSSTPTITNSVIQESGGSGSFWNIGLGIDGGGNIDANPLLGVLQNNGGITPTMALLPSSPAIDAGHDSSCPATDQRGVTRPQGSHCDIGAYEFFSTKLEVGFGAADFNGDGKTDVAVFRPSNSTWYIQGVGSFVYGTVGDIPVLADYNGDGKDDVAVFRPSNSTWYIYGVGPRVYGTVGDIPVVGDYNGDGKADIAVFRPTNSTWYIYGVGPRVYGTVRDIPVVGDYNGDGKAEVAVFRPTNSTWYIYGIGPRVYGTVGDLPVVGDYNGDGQADIAVFRPTNSTWYIYGVGPSVYGTVDDIPV